MTGRYIIHQMYDIVIISAPREYTKRYYQTHVKFTQDQSSRHLSHSHTKTKNSRMTTSKLTKPSNQQTSEPTMA